MNVLDIFNIERRHVNGEYTLYGSRTRVPVKNSRTPFEAIYKYDNGSERYFAECLGTDKEGRAISNSGKVLTNYIPVPRELKSALEHEDFMLRSFYDNNPANHVIHSWSLPCLHILKETSDKGCLFNEKTEVLCISNGYLLYKDLIGRTSNGMPIFDSNNGDIHYIIDLSNLDSNLDKLIKKLFNLGNFEVDRECIKE